MGPTKPLSTREKRLARIRGDIPAHLPHKTHRPDAVVPDGFLSTKRDKRTMKHSVLLSKVKKSASAEHTRPLKRRRPNKKLVATLESLADALPELGGDEEGEGGGQGRGLSSKSGDGKFRHKSLKSRPGALKRKEKVVSREMVRFGANMAALAATHEEGRDVGMGGEATAMATASAETNGVPTPTPAPSTSNRWAALRKHISSTMEQSPAFAPQ